jgi:hypothetical protein
METIKLYLGELWAEILFNGNVSNLNEKTNNLIFNNNINIVKSLWFI